VIHPNAALCLLSQNRGQIITEEPVLLKIIVTDIETASFYWNNYLDQYWRDFYCMHQSAATHSETTIPASFGIIALQPIFWELLIIKPDDF